MKENNKWCAVKQIKEEAKESCVNAKKCCYFCEYINQCSKRWINTIKKFGIKKADAVGSWNYCKVYKENRWCSAVIKNIKLYGIYRESFIFR